MNNKLTIEIFGDKLNEVASLSDYLSYLNSMGLLNIGELAELAISKTSTSSRCPANFEGYDLENKVEIKHGQTHERNLLKKKPRNRAYFSKDKKTGPIAAVITEEITGKQYYFFVPYSIYTCWHANSISIPFELNGRPVKTKKKNTGKPNIWDYEIDNYDLLCDMVKNYSEV